MKRVGAAMAMVLGLTAAGQAQAPAIGVWPVRGDVYLLAGPDGNSTVQMGRDGVLVVDAQTAAAAPAVLEAIAALSAQPIRFVVNTTSADAHVGGNAVVAQAGRIVEGGNERSAVVYSAGDAAPVYAHENTLNHLVAAGGAPAGWPTDTYFVAQKDLFVNGEAVVLYHVPAAVTDGDTVVFFRRSDVIATGDIFTPDRYPMIDLERGGSINGFLDAVNFVLRLAIPEHNEEGGTLLVPGHGRLGDEADLSEYRDMATIVRDRVQDMVDRGLSLDETVAAAPSREYDGIYSRPAWTGDMFVAAIYRSVAGAGP